ncbi:unnamed protein product [Rhizophagus irregularis]|uniref:Uncharacterized protein n=1 Tax=Rhizophagus irregularis TaxID=588596 RepID=A0A2I1GI16_9GLOM|nr:hypothetical protein RhiirA4_543205 [Rhizophagus irregularis]CAB4411922.1 unnamed protein product [Rhizophagus irregularis]
MGNSLEKTSQTTSDTLPFKHDIKSGIYGYMMSVDEIINTAIKQLTTSQLYNCCIDPLELNNIPCFSPVEKSDLSKFSIVNLSRNVCSSMGKEYKSEFESIYDFLKFNIEGKLLKSKLNEINSVLRDGLKQIQVEIEDLEKNLSEDELKAQLKKFSLALNNWGMEKSHMWASISRQLLEFIQSHADGAAFNNPKCLEIYITALCLYAFARLRSERKSQEEPIDKQIQRVIDDACKLLRKFIQNVTYHNAEASFKREQNPYYGIEELPGCGPVDIFCGLHKGLKSATIQKFACEDNQAISFDKELQEINSFKLGFSKLHVLLPKTFYKQDKENNNNIIVDVRVPFRYNFDSSFDIDRIWDYRREIWQFKPNEYCVYISPLVFRAIHEISVISAVINSNETENSVFERPSYSKLAKTFERKLLYSVEITSEYEKVVENQEPWKVYVV